MPSLVHSAGYRKGNMEAAVSVSTLGIPIHRLLLPLKSCPALHGLASPLPMETQTFPISVPSGHNAS